MSVLLLLLACAPPTGLPPLPFAPAGPDAAPDPGARGPFEVGVFTVEVAVPGHTLPDGSPRVLPVEIWYPAEGAGDALRAYPLADAVPPEVLEQQGLTADDLPLVISTSWDEAAPETGRGDFPLVIFSHGSGGLRVQSMFLTEFLASHGFVVAAPDHLGNTLGDFLRPGADEDALTIRSFADRPGDVAAVVDAVLDDPAVAGRLPPIDPERLGIAGHSLGSWTAVQVAARGRVGDGPAFDVVVAEAPPDTQLAVVGTGLSPDQLNVPVLLQAGDQDRILDYEDNAVAGFGRLVSPAWLATYAGAGHFTFSDLCVQDLGPLQDLINDSVGDALEDGCGPDNLDPVRALPLVRHHAVALLNGVLRHSPASLALLAAPLSPEVQVQAAP